MGKIIAFAGRIGSGKSELASICQNADFEKLYFALPLKKLVADLIRVDLSDINDLKYVEKDYQFNKMDYMMLSNETGIPYKIISEKMSQVQFKTVRQLLQFIGTDLIRNYNTDWHVNKIRKMVKDDVNYVFDDVRFKNELDLIKELGGDCWFVVRPIISNVSNHESETTLRWQDFGDKVIINDGCLTMFRFKWETFFKHYDDSLIARDKFLSSGHFKNWKEVYADLTEILNTIDLLEISQHWLTYEPREFNGGEITDVSQDDKTNDVIITYNHNVKEVVRNPLNIEDLKFYI